MKVLVFSDTYPPFINGVSTSVFNLVKMFRNRGHQVMVVTPRSSDGPLEVIDNVVYMPGIENKKLYGYRFPKFYDRKVMQMVKEFKPDVIHYHTDSMLGVFARIAAHKLHCPLVYTYHTSYEDYTYYATKGFLDRVAKKTLRGILRPNRGGEAHHLGGSPSSRIDNADRKARKTLRQLRRRGTARKPPADDEHVTTVHISHTAPRAVEPTLREKSRRNL